MPCRSKLVFMNGSYTGKSIVVSPEKTLTIGRDRGIDLSLDDEQLSRRHCMISFNGDHYYIADLGSVNGTFMNGSKISEPTELHAFDRIFFGNTEMEFREDTSD